MGRKCSVIGCNSGYESDRSGIKKKFFRFPKDPFERLKWVEALPNKLNVSEVTDNMTVCSRHFREDVATKKCGNHKIPTEPPTEHTIKGKTFYGGPQNREIATEPPTEHTIKEKPFHGAPQNREIPTEPPTEHTIKEKSLYGAPPRKTNNSNDCSINKELLLDCFQFLCECKSFSGTVDHPEMAGEDERVKVLKQEYLWLYKKFQHLKELARIDLDLLSLSVDLENVPNAKAELDRVHELVHVVMKEEIFPQMDPFNQEQYEASCEVVETDQVNLVENLKTDNMKLVEDSPIVKTEDISLESDFESCVNAQTISTNSALKLLDVLLAQLTSIFTEQQMIDAFGRLVNKVYSAPTTSEKDLPHTQTTQVSQSLELEETDCMDPLTEALEDEGENTADDTIQGANNSSTQVKVCNSTPKVKNIQVKVKSFNVNQKRLQETPNQETKDMAMDTKVTSIPTNDLIMVNQPGASTHGKRSEQPKKKCSRKMVSLLNPSQQMIFEPGNANNVKKASGEKCELTEKRLAQTDHVAVTDAPTLATSISCQNLITTTMPDIEKKDNDKKESTTTDVPIFTCAKCGEILDDRNLFNQHLKIHAREDNVCTVCGQQFASKTGLKSHMELHSSEKRFLCNICGKRFHTVRYLKRHEEYHDKNRPKLYCELCGKPFTSRDNLSKHRKSQHSGEKIFKCSYCDKQCKNFNTLTSHERQHKEHFPHQCSKCGRGFKLPKQLTIHERIHIGESPYFTCPICHEKFSTKAQRNTHKSNHLKETPKLHNCSVCEKQFNGRRAMARHMLTHPEDLRFCSLCQQEFDSSSDLQSHVTNMHLVEKPFECKDCGKFYSSMPSLYSHRSNVHLKKKKYQCEICGRNFFSKTNFYRHVRCHQGIKPWKCSVCEKEFGAKDNLRVHMWTHRADKRYNCEDCGRGFNEKRAFLSHRKTHHQDHQNSLGIND